MKNIQTASAKIVTWLLGYIPSVRESRELFHEAQLAKSMGIPFHKIQSMMHVYMTCDDSVKRLAVAAYVE